MIKTNTLICIRYNLCYLCVYVFRLFRGFFEMGERHGTGVGQFNSGAIYHGDKACD